MIVDSFFENRRENFIVLLNIFKILQVKKKYRIKVKLNAFIRETFKKNESLTVYQRNTDVALSIWSLFTFRGSFQRTHSRHGCFQP